MAGSTVKIGVDVTQFKQGMAQAQQSAKTFQTQMKANEAQFKATGDREQYMTEKGRLLKQQLEAQKTAAANAEKALEAMRRNGVEKTSNEYQKMEQSLAGAQAAMYDTQAAMNTLATSEGRASSGATELSNSLSGIGKKVSFDAVINGIDRITGGLEKAATKVIDIGQGIWNEMVKSAQWADDTATLALMYDVPLEELLKTQSLVANGLDTTVDAILGAQAKMRRGVGNGSIADDLDKIGVSMYKVIGYGKYGPITQLKESNELFWEAGQAIYNLGQEYDKEAIATAIFGKSWRELMPLFDKYKTFEEFKKARDSVNANTEDEVNALAELNDKLGELENNFDILKNKFLAELAPALTSASEVLSGLLTSLLDYLDTPEGKQALADLGTAVSGLFEDLKKIDPEEVVAGFAGVFNSIIGGLQWLEQNQTLLEGILTAIVGGWATAKIAGGALTVLELVNGLITLKNTKKINIPQIDGNGGLGGGGSQTVNSQNVSNQSVTTQNVTTGNATTQNVTTQNATTQNTTTQNATTQNVTTGNVSNETVTNGTFTTANFTTGNTQTETVQTMYVQNMIGGPNTGPSTNYNPVIPNDGSGGYPSLPYSQPYRLPTGGGDGFNGYYSPFITGPSGFNLGNGGDFNIDTGGGDVNLNLPSGGDNDFIRVDPDAFNNVSDTPVGEPYDTVLKDGGGGTAVGLWQLFKMKVGGAATSLATADPTGVTALIFPWLLDKTEGGRILRDGGGVKEAMDAESQAILDTVKDIPNRYKSWVDDMYNAVFGKDTQGVTDAAQTVLTEAGELLKEANEAIEDDNEEPDYPSNWGMDDYGFWEGGEPSPSDVLDSLGAKLPQDIESGMKDTKASLDNSVEIMQTLPELTANAVKTGISGMAINIGGIFSGNVAKLANGIDSVPWDGYPALLHKGERVLTARENQQYTFNNYFGSVNLNNGLEIEALTESIEKRNRRQRSGYGAA